MRTEAAKWEWRVVLRGLTYEFVEFRPELAIYQVASIKGMEYQHVLLVIGEDLFEQLESGFEGSGQGEYHNRRMMRIPFTRAKDSLVTIVSPVLPTFLENPVSWARPPRLKG